MKSIGDEKTCTDWMQGYNDCKDGIPHEAGRSDAYTRGYGTRYEEEQLMTAGVMRK